MQKRMGGYNIRLPNSANMRTTNMSSATSVSHLPIDAAASSPTRRVAGIDVARGVALLGIFFVNANHFGEPLLNSSQTAAPISQDG